MHLLGLKIKLFFISVLILVAILSNQVLAKIFLLLSENSAPYLEVSAKIKKNFPSARKFYLDSIDKSFSPAIFNGDILVCLGTKALEWALNNNINGEIVFSLVLKPKAEYIESCAARESRLYGIFLAFPIERYTYWIRKLFPEIKKIGVIYADPYSFYLKTPYYEEKQSQGNLIFYKLFSIDELEKVLQKIAVQTEAMIIAPDEILINKIVFPRLVLFAIEQNKVFATISKNLARAGALMTLGWDFSSIGDQTVSLIKRLLSKKRIEQKFYSPEKEVVYINAKILKILELELPLLLPNNVIVINEEEFEDGT